MSRYIQHNINILKEYMSSNLAGKEYCLVPKYVIKITTELLEEYKELFEKQFQKAEESDKNV